MIFHGTIEVYQQGSITMKFVKTIHIPEVTLDEYAAQLEVTNEEALAILDADVDIDVDLDTALELE